MRMMLPLWWKINPNTGEEEAQISITEGEDTKT